MARPRVIIVDEDINYIIPMQLKFVKDFFNQIDLEIVTDREYFNELFSKPQKAEILIISDVFYEPSLQRHNIANIFVMMEQYEEGGTEDLNINKLFKYTSIKEIFNEIIGKSASTFNIENSDHKETQMILITSASGGVGKTTVAMGVSSCLVRNYKRVLYINASRLQCFLHMLDNNAVLLSPEIYTILANPTDHVYEDIKHIIRKELFNYLPPFKAALMSVGLEYSVYEQIAISAKKSGDYDFIVIDAESTFDEYKTRFLDIADKVVVVTGQSVSAVKATNLFVSNINGTASDKYVFVCNNFDKEKMNALIMPSLVLKFNVNDYIEKIDEHELENAQLLANSSDIQKISFLML